MNLKLVLLAVLPASIGASTSFYRPSQTAQVLSKNELLNKVTPLPADACDERIALSLRGGEGSTNVDVPKANELTGAAFFTVLQVLLF